MKIQKMIITIIAQPRSLYLLICMMFFSCTTAPPINRSEVPYTEITKSLLLNVQDSLLFSHCIESDTVSSGEEAIRFYYAVNFFGFNSLVSSQINNGRRHVTIYYFGNEKTKDNWINGITPGKSSLGYIDSISVINENDFDNIKAILKSKYPSKSELLKKVHEGSLPKNISLDDSNTNSITYIDLMDMFTISFTLNDTTEDKSWHVVF